MILLTGGNGQLGSAFRRSLGDVVALDRSRLDLSRPDDLESVIAPLQPTAIINCAAYTLVEDAESHRAEAETVNARAVGVLAAIAAARGIPFVTFSTDFVFDGEADTPYTESSTPNPINAYGESKLRGERAALEAHTGALVIRTAWVFSATHTNFVTTILDRVRAGTVAVVTDQVGSPTFADDLAASTLTALDHGATGLLHLTNAGAASRFDLARRVCRAAGIDPERIRPVTSDAYPSAARRPKYSVLGSDRRRVFGLADLRPWEAAVDAALGFRPLTDEPVPPR